MLKLASITIFEPSGQGNAVFCLLRSPENNNCLLLPSVSTIEMPSLEVIIK